MTTETAYRDNIKKRVGIIAGYGALPVIVAKNASKQGMDVISIAFAEETVNGIRPYSNKVFYLGLGQAGKIIKVLQDEGIKELLLIGKIEKRLLFNNLKFDITAIKILNKLRNKNDDTIMLAIVDELEQRGIKVIEQTNFLDHIQERGVLTKTHPTEKEYGDIRFGFDIAKHIAGMDIGQTVIVKDKTVLAIEAIEGTDEAIRRGASLCKEGAVIVKVSKPKQDLRFDIPTVGSNTISVMKYSSAKVLAIEAKKTFIVDKEEVIKQANSASISIVSI